MNCQSVFRTTITNIFSTTKNNLRPKECACCNEGAFRRVQVRLNDCRQTPAGSRKILLAAEEDQADLAYYRKVSEQPTELGFMDVEVEEPIECKCRRCDSTLW